MVPLLIMNEWKTMNHKKDQNHFFSLLLESKTKSLFFNCFNNNILHQNSYHLGQKKLIY